MTDLVRPRSFVPSHGEYRMLAAHSRTAEEAGVNPLACLTVEDGDAIEWRPEEIAAAVPHAVSAGRLYLDARGAFADVGEVALRDRQLLAETGMLVCLCVLDHKSGEVVRGPELLGKGVAGLDESRLAQARQAALDALAELNPAQRTDHGLVEDGLRRRGRPVWEKGPGKRPLGLPGAMRIWPLA